MTKTSFYTLLSNGKTVDAVLKHGYSDGTFYYYTDGTRWHAIHPLVGRSVAVGYSRKNASEQAHQLIEKVNKAMEKRGAEFTEQFENAIKRLKAQNVEVTT